MQLSSPDIVTFGESMALLMPKEHMPIERSSSLDLSFGGAESNVAIGLARLGVSVGWCGTLGADPYGTLILKTLRGEGVDISRATLSSEAPTGTMLREHVAGKLAVHYFRKHSAASQMKPEDLDEEYIRGAQILHITGITPALSDNGLATIKHAVSIAKQAGVKISFDPNLRLKLWSIEEARAVLLPIAAEADYFLPGWDELKLLYDTEDYEEVKTHLRALKAISIIKGKDNSTIVLEKDTETAVPFYKAEQVVDTVGAGDGFCSGFLAGISKGMSLVEATKLASINGSLVIQMRGDWEALPDYTSVERLLLDKVWVER
ncbi:sugar kinase [Paenibacillus yanchengensis]|uniref:Sugar kinase n=1 Tax=Paenibacillus yanchengensis TaxID=2035833 RepID=A0ABW4YLL9_9BACL